MSEPTSQQRVGRPRRWVEPRRLSVRGEERGCQTLEAGGAGPVPLGGAVEFGPPHPANGVGLGSPAVSATATPPFPWETACEPTPTPSPHPRVERET